MLGSFFLLMASSDWLSAPTGLQRPVLEPNYGDGALNTEPASYSRGLCGFGPGDVVD